MSRTIRCKLICFFLFFVPFVSFVVGSPPARAGEFRFKDGDRVALVGNTLIEREQKYGYWELALTTRHPDKNITFRNLGWSGDTVWGESRVGFDLDNPKKGFERLRDAVLAVKPTVIIVGYGTNESFAGEAGLPRFKEGLNKLLDAFAPAKARVVLLAPAKLRDCGLPLPNREEHNRVLTLYSDAIRAIAEKQQQCFIDLEKYRFWFSETWKTPDLIANGMDLSEFGYWRYAAAIESGLGRARRHWYVKIEAPKGVSEIRGVRIGKLDLSASGFESTDALVPVPWPHAREPLPKTMVGYLLGGDVEWIAEPSRDLRIEGLKPGKYQLKIDGKRITEGSAMDWSFGKDIERCPEFDQAEKLRQLIIEKNQLFFHRYRPQNETYLFGFHKYEQGQNAVEVSQFDALIEAKEKEIAKLRVPVKHTYELIRQP